MGKWTPCQRKDFIRKLKQLDFGSPVKEIELGIKKKISLEEWKSL